MLGSQFREYVGNIVQVKDETTGKMIDKVKDEAKFAKVVSQLKVLA